MWRYYYVFVFLVVNIHIKSSFASEVVPCANNGNINDLLDINGTSVTISLENIKSAHANDTTLYIVEYSLIKHLGCSDYLTVVNTNETQANASETEIILENLVPFSIYNFTLWKMGETKTCIEGGTFNMDESDVLGDEEKPTIQDFLNLTEVVVTIRWPCETLLGQILHEIVVSCGSQSCVRQTFDFDYVERTPSTIVIKFPATRLTKYVINLRYWRGDDTESMIHDVYVNVNEPNKVRDLQIYEANETDVSLRWLPPTSNTGELEFYEVEYYQDIDTKTVRVGITSYCEIWTSYICTTIRDEDFLDQSYTFEVRAKNLLVEKRGWFSIAQLPARRKKVPSPPLDLYYEKKNNGNIIVNWQHPDAPNGPILRFYIEVDDSIRLTYDVPEQRLHYSYEINLHDYNLPSEKVLIEIIAANKFGSSNSSTTWTVEPKFLENPIIRNETDSTFDIEFSSTVDVKGDTSKMYVIITDPYLPTEQGKILHPRALNLFEATDVNKNYSWIIGEFDLADITDQLLLTVGDDSNSVSKIDSNWTFSNKKLESEHEYNVTVVLNDTLFSTSKLKTYALSAETAVAVSTVSSTVVISSSDGNSTYFWSLLLIPASLCIVWVAFMNAVRQRRKTLVSKILFCDFCDNYNNPHIFSYPARPMVDNIYDVVLDEGTFSKMVKIQELDNYIKSSTESEELVKQYALFDKAPIKSHFDGSMIQNRAKNRYPTLIAYDDTRVKLEVVDGDPFSDYINANYINGYDRPKAYIATQTPTDNTYSDFWRMIWQENVKYIIAASNVTQQDQDENSGIYWPETHDPLIFDNIRVVYKNIEVMPNYKIRHFSLVCNKEERKIEQLHFFGVPDYYRVPLYIHSLSSFVKKILSILDENSPLVVHCSDGITHTGIVILCDICLRMAISEGQVDILRQLYKLRNQRMNMVNSVEQYKVVHFVLLQILECLKISTNSGVICDRTMESTIENILSTKIAQQMRYLDESAWQEDAMNDIDLIYDCLNKGSQVPVFAQLLDDPPHNQLYQYRKIGDSHLYITTAIVDSYTIPSKYVVTPKPITATLGVFWQFIFDTQIEIIVSLNKLALIADFEDTFNPSPTLEVTCIDCTRNEHFAVYTLQTNEISNKDNKLEVKIIHVLGWSPNMIHPETPDNLIMAYEEMSRLATTRSILITCQDGIQASGLFMAMCFLIEKIGMEHVCDVCLAVKSVRQSRKDYVRKAEQFAFLYLCALKYVRKFGSYSNFDAPTNDVETVSDDSSDLYNM